MSKRIVSLLAGILGLASSATAFANPEASTPAAPVLALTMNEAVVRALDANLEISIERLKPEQAEQRRMQALGTFDPRLEVGGTMESLERPQNTRDFFATGRAVEIMNEENMRVEGSLGGVLPTGTRYNVTIRAYELKNTLNREALARFYPEYTSSTTFTVSQPLLRGAGLKANLAEMRIAETERRAAEQSLRGRVDQIATNVLDAYIESLYARELVRVITDRIALAEQLRAENEKRLQQGLMAPIDVMQAESTKAAAEIELIRANSFLLETENRLRELLFTDFLAGADTSFDLVDPLGEVALTESLPALRHLALERNAEYQVALQRVEAEKLRVGYARNQFKPRIDLQASVGLNGLGGDIGTSFSDYGERTQPDYSVGLIGSIPLGFTLERARLREALLRQREAELEVQRTTNRLYGQVHTAHTRVVSAMRRAVSAARAVSTAEASLTAEQKRLVNGLTTSFNVLRLQDELAQARVNRLEAIAEGHKALAILWGVTGTLFERYQINLIEAPGATRRS
jgi:outer membrane protein TolC